MRAGDCWLSMAGHLPTLPTVSYSHSMACESSSLQDWEAGEGTQVPPSRCPALQLSLLSSTVLPVPGSSPASCPRADVPCEGWGSPWHRGLCASCLLSAPASQAMGPATEMLFVDEGTEMSQLWGLGAVRQARWGIWAKKKEGWPLLAE